MEKLLKIYHDLVIFSVHATGPPPSAQFLTPVITCLVYFHNSSLPK